MKTLIKLALLSAVVLVAQNSKSEAPQFWAPPSFAYERYREGSGCAALGSECWNWNTGVTNRNNKVTAEYRARIPLNAWLAGQR